MPILLKILAFQFIASLTLTFHLPKKMDILPNMA